ncbi:branched-chain amino acid ABC transporter ATP-binding protein/permease [Brevibacillus ruminantium]|uniref:Branched-chain amino acid ABC transporter ATP-binding protein/permease n=1 Tax=Brevibacillus ruminantium TaxID=2950604 RepID=A0ABY4WMA9_9BACL|nr:branched-chain amino acid ABC transporter ATP-binding protein/permease [Brevibacillus ruminantium]USG68004.1 branched-chain amino acid ABC transporter ATP-binding protein/permease [Brevibacillus ruminantium]
MKKGLLYLLVAVALYFFPWLFPNSYYVHMAQGFLYTYIVVAGLNLLVGLSGQLSLGHAGFYAIGAYVTGLCTVAGMPFLLSLLLGVLLCAAAGGLVAMLSLRAKGPYLAMVTIAFGLLVEIVANRWVEVTGGPAGLYLPEARLFGAPLGTVSYYWFIAVVALIVTVLIDNLFTSRFGRTFRAMGNSEVAAATVGVHVRNWKIMAFAISACTAGLAGALFAFQNAYFNSDTFTFDKSILFLVGVIVGGAGTRLGPLVGTVVIFLLPQWVQSLYDYHLLIFGGILLVSLIALPEGIVGGVERLLKERKKLPPAAGEESSQEADAPSQMDNKAGAALTVDSVVMEFDGFRAVDDINLSISGSEVRGLIGPNGSGKSTTVNMLSGVYVPTQGKLRWKGVDVTNYPPHRMAAAGITRTFQNLQLFHELTVLENVMLGFHMHYRTGFTANLLHTPGFWREEKRYRDESIRLLHFVGLADKADEQAANLSYGQQRLVEIARALATRPDLLILDEPAAGASMFEVDNIVRVIRKVKQSGISILLVEHHMEIVMNVCDTITVLDFGKKIAEGDPAYIQSHPQVIEAYLGGEEVTQLVVGK